VNSPTNSSTEYHYATKHVSDRLSALLGATVTVTDAIIETDPQKLAETIREVSNISQIVAEDWYMPTLHQVPAGEDGNSIGYPITLLVGAPAGKLSQKQADVLTAMLGQGMMEPIDIPVFFFQSGVVQEVHVDPVKIQKLIIHAHIHQQKRSQQVDLSKKDGD
jgi:hypothetical protein